ncbi:hypothetical protein B7463_g8983, partial [Scytalidium lignicola]
MGMKDPKPTFSYLVQELKKLKLGHMHIVVQQIAGGTGQESEGDDSIDFLLDTWDSQSPVLLAGGFTAESAKEVVEQYHDKDIIVVFGRYFISNPDLPFRIKEGIELTPYNRAKFYANKNPDGYISYEFSKQFLEADKSHGAIEN